MQKYSLFLFHLLICGLMCASFMQCSQDTNNAAPGTTGTGGSMARFTISGDHLYTVNNSQLQVFDISQTANPTPVNTISLGFGIETIFPYGNHLFIGSQTGMHIYNVSDPANPSFISRFDHIQSCDPVVVQGNYAYITLRDGTSCRFGQNQLDVVDISDLHSPKMVASHTMQNPHGLAIDDTMLFVCEGGYGLKVFNATDPLNLVLRQHITTIHAYDVIPRHKVLLAIGNNGLHQYDYSRSDTLQLLSSLPIENQ